MTWNCDQTLKTINFCCIYLKMIRSWYKFKKKWISQWYVFSSNPVKTLNFWKIKMEICNIKLFSWLILRHCGRFIVSMKPDLLNYIMGKVEKILYIGIVLQHYLKIQIAVLWLSSLRNKNNRLLSHTLLLSKHFACIFAEKHSRDIDILIVIFLNINKKQKC